MKTKAMQLIITSPMFVLLLGGLVRAEEQKAADGLIEFTSKEGGFSIRLPAKPKHETTTVGDAKDIQHQFLVGGPQGVYLVSYQDNPNLAGGDEKLMQFALESGRDRLLKTFRGELVENAVIKLDKVHPGLSFRITMPQAKGEARCRFYMVGTRLYQTMAMGVPEFVVTDEATRVLDSFQLLK